MNSLCTLWGENIDPNHLLSEYPRPQLVRTNYEILNGYWDYAYGADAPTNDWDGQILVPFSPESDLSGVGRQTMPGEVLWYHRRFTCPEDGAVEGGHLLLHFGAVDQQCQVYVNGQRVGAHMGGYLPFSCDITEALHKGENELLVRVQDDSDHSYHARGKQKLKRGGMFYTASSGIWQTVWMEWVPPVFIRSIHLVPEVDEKWLQVEVQASRPIQAGDRISVRIFDPLTRDVVQEASGRSIDLSVLPNYLLWTPDTPWLYDIEITLSSEEGEDRIASYFALRSFTLEHVGEEEFPRICLNHQPLYQRGVLDQGYWPESLLTPPDDEAMIFDILQMKKTGYNMVRKHLKIEPDRWYYHCDRLGLIVWQDMVNGGSMLHQWFVTYVATPLSYFRIPVSDRHSYLLSRTSAAGRDEFRGEVVETVRLLWNHPCICTWVIFNEGWGQFQTRKLTEMVRRLDPKRFIDQASGWFDQGGGDFASVHNYFFKLITRPEKHRGYVLSEVGGRVLYTPDHCMVEKTYGYSSSTDAAQLNAEYDKLQAKLQSLVSDGLCASIYTQWTDIEDEINGVYTYDRKVRKIEEKTYK